MTDTRLEPIEMHRRYWPETFDELLLPLIAALHHADQWHRQRAEVIMAIHGLTPAEFDVLATLRRSPPPGELTPSEIQRGMLITSGGLTKVLQQLESRGLITRTTSETDRRIKPVHLTLPAVQLIEKAMSELITVIRAAIESKLSVKETNQLVILLNKASGRIGHRTPS